jgi:hypothetical protein
VGSLRTAPAPAPAETAPTGADGAAGALLLPPPKMRLKNPETPPLLDLGFCHSPCRPRNTTHKQAMRQRILGAQNAEQKARKADSP